MEGLHLKLLNDFQRRFPLVPRPFEVLARRCNCSESDVLASLRELNHAGAVSRVGAVFAPNRVGASTLFALALPAERLAQTAAWIDRFPEVNHNYEREHRFNLWSVATATDEDALQRVLDAVRARAQAPLLDLPLLEEYRIDLGFDLTRPATAAEPVALNGPRIELQPAERALVAALQAGLPLVPEPFRALATRLGMSEQSLLAALSRWVAAGVIRRFGVIVRHRELGYRANAMAVWDVPDDRVGAIGRELASIPGVTLAYRRRRAPPAWTYNLFCMVHGKERSTVLDDIARIRNTLHLSGCPHAVLFSRRRFKQTGARYMPDATAVAHG